MIYKINIPALRILLVILVFLSVLICFTENSVATTINIGNGEGNESSTIQVGINQGIYADIIHNTTSHRDYNEMFVVNKSKTTVYSTIILTPTKLTTGALIGYKGDHVDLTSTLQDNNNKFH